MQSLHHVVPHAQVNEQRKAQIERVNAQLSDLYGPLLACVTATKSAYTALVRQHSPDGTREGLQAAVAQHPDGPEARAFRSWMRSVLQPLNERAAGAGAPGVLHHTLPLSGQEPAVIPAPAPLPPS